MKKGCKAQLQKFKKLPRNWLVDRSQNENAMGYEIHQRRERTCLSSSGVVTTSESKYSKILCCGTHSEPRTVEGFLRWKIGRRLLFACHTLVVLYQLWGSLRDKFLYGFQGASPICVYLMAIWVLEQAQNDTSVGAGITGSLTLSHLYVQDKDKLARNMANLFFSATQHFQRSAT